METKRIRSYIYTFRQTTGTSLIRSHPKLYISKAGCLIVSSKHQRFPVQNSFPPNCASIATGHSSDSQEDQTNAPLSSLRPSTLAQTTTCTQLIVGQIFTFSKRGHYRDANSAFSFASNYLMSLCGNSRTHAQTYRIFLYGSILAGTQMQDLLNP